MAVCLSLLMLDVPAYSRASTLLQCFVLTMNVVNDTNPLWELACQRWRCVCHF